MALGPTRKIEDLIRALHRDWASTQVVLKKWADDPNRGEAPPTATIDRVLLSPEGGAIIVELAERLLSLLGLERRVREETAHAIIVKALDAELDRSYKTGRFSAKIVFDAATSALQVIRPSDGTYVFPVVLARQAVATNIRIGPVRLLAKPIFEKLLASNFEEARAVAADDKGQAVALRKWDAFQEHYDHFLLVGIVGHEYELARKAGREVAEFTLNLIRMYINFAHADDIRLGEGWRWEVEQASVRIGMTGQLNFSHSYGPWGTNLRDEWQAPFTEELAPFIGMLGNFSEWVTSGVDAGDPVLDRLRYAHLLIAECYSEPNDRIRLVRVIAALEALALPDPTEKAETLAQRCEEVALVEEGVRSEISAAVGVAYKIRNAVVHGDAPAEYEARQAFIGLEKYLLEVVLGFMRFHATIRTEAKPKSIRELRREANKRRPKPRANLRGRASTEWMKALVPFRRRRTK